MTDGEDAGGKSLDFQEEDAPSLLCTIAVSFSGLYLALGPQIVKRAPGPCVQIGKNCCHPSGRFEPRHDPDSRQSKGGEVG